MEQLLGLLPKIHLGLAVILLTFYLVRANFLIKGSKAAYSKNMNSTSSFITLAVFFSGISLAFLQKTPFSDPYILTKIIGLLVFVAFSVAAFFPRRKKSTAILLLGLAFSLLAYLFLYTFFFT